MTSKNRKNIKNNKNSKNGSYSVSDGTNTITLSTRKLKRQEFIQRKAQEAALQLKMTSDEVHFYSKVKKNMTKEEYLDRRNILHTIFSCYDLDYEIEPDILFNNSTLYDNVEYSLLHTYCKKQFYYNNHKNNTHFWREMHETVNDEGDVDYVCSVCKYIHKISDMESWCIEFLKNCNLTNKYLPNKYLPDIYSTYNWINPKNDMINISSEHHYILDGKFYWKYVYMNNRWIIKFYPNVHDDKIYLFDKICGLMRQHFSKNRLKRPTFKLFYLISTMPLKIRDKIKSYL
jgi:hypothetical protein